MISKPLLDRTEKGPIETSREKNIEKYTQNIQINHRKYPLSGNITTFELSVRSQEWFPGNSNSEKIYGAFIDDWGLLMNDSPFD